MREGKKERRQGGREKEKHTGERESENGNDRKKRERKDALDVFGDHRGILQMKVMSQLEFYEDREEGSGKGSKAEKYR